MLDKEKLRERLRGIFLDELDRHVATLREAMQTLQRAVDEQGCGEDLEVARRAAHSLKGAARSAGVLEIQKSALQVERAFTAVIQGTRPLSSLDFPLLFGAADAFEAAGLDLRAQRPVAGTRVEQIFPELEALAEGRSAGRSEAAAAKRVLVVDDSDTNRNFMKIILEADGLTVLTAADGEVALEVLRGNPVDVVLADVNMPRMDGFGLLSAVRRSADWSALPVVLLSGLDDPTERRRAEDAGASAYLAKGSTDNQSLLRTVRALAG